MTTKTELYRHWDSEGRLLYVGISQSAERRLAQHVASSPWRDEIARMTIEVHPTRGAAVDAEAEAILKECPMYNKAGRPRQQQLAPVVIPQRALAFYANQPYDPAEEMAKLEHWLARTTPANP